MSTTEETEVQIKATLEDLTGNEVIAIEKYFQSSINKMSHLKALYGVVWAIKNRDGQKTPWSEILNMTVRDLMKYIPDEEDPDEEDPLETSKPEELQA